MKLTVDRETITTALVTKLKSVVFSTPVSDKTTFTEVSRRLKIWSDVSKYERPWAGLVCHSELPVYRSGNQPPYFKLSYRLFVYTDSSDKTLNGDVDLNTILEAVGAVLHPGPGEQRQTLGGVVFHCRVDGEILRDPGDLDGDGLLIIPISVTLT